MHPATFPESLAEEFISFFTNPGGWILDPFLGSGSTLVAARCTGRNGVGIELYPYFASFAEKRVSQSSGNTSNVVLVGDSTESVPRLTTMGFPLFDLCITSPPYWHQLSMTGERTRERTSKNLRLTYGGDSKDLGNIRDYKAFLRSQEKIFNRVYKVMKPGGYLVVITNNVYWKKRLYPLAFDTFRDLSKKWVPKDERIWCQDDKDLIPFGMWTAWVGNRSHHYCLIFRKE
jgi:DNA modification methylase